MPQDVSIDPFKHPVVQDDDVVIAALPKRVDRCGPRTVHVAHNTCAVGSNDRTQRSRSRSQWALTKRGRNTLSGRPIGQFDHTVDMVRHDGERVGIQMSVMSRHAIPVFVSDPSIGVQKDFAIDEVPEPWFTILRAERHEIQAG